ncbi:MAG: hypothetical protein NT062_37395, partial [Proteobacteria bacterium]|nr:hypothetical protein [Pseudomonadota bacterium]
MRVVASLLGLALLLGGWAPGCASERRPSGELPLELAPSSPGIPILPTVPEHASMAMPSSPPRVAYAPVAIDVEVRGHGRPIIFLPGLGCAPWIFDATIDHLGAGYEAH